jgi:hypothetical protein
MPTCAKPLTVLRSATIWNQIRSPTAFRRCIIPPEVEMMSVRLKVVGLDGTSYEFADVPGEARVRDIVDAYVAFVANPMLSLRADNPGFLVADSVDLATGESTRLPLEATLSASHIDEESMLRVSARASAGGITPSTLFEFVGASIAAGVIGNLAYDLLKVSLQRVRTRWARQHDRSLERDEALELTRATICLNFGLDEPSRLELLSAVPVVARFNGRVLESLRPMRRRGRSRAAYWRCSYRVPDVNGTSSVTVLIGVDAHMPSDPEYLITYLLTED